MKSIKSLLAVIIAVCMMMSLAIPTFATEETTAATTEAVTEASTEEVTEAATEDATEAATEEVTEAGTEEATEAATEEETDGTEEDIEVPVEGEDDHEGHDHEHEETTEVPEESLSTVQIILIVFEVIVSIALICVVLMQSGKESGLSGALSGNSDSYMNKGGRANLDKKLASATKWIGLVWILLALILCLV